MPNVTVLTEQMEKARANATKTIRALTEWRTGKVGDIDHTAGQKAGLREQIRASVTGIDDAVAAFKAELAL